MKRILTLAFLLISLFVSAQSRTEVLKVYNWDEVLHSYDIENFEKWYEEQTGEKIKVIYQIYDTDLVAVNSVKMSHDDWDVITISSNFLKSMIENGYLQKIDTSYFAATGTPNYIAKISPFLKEKLANAGFPGGVNPNDYATPIAVSFSGLFYNKDKYSEEEISTWKIFEDSKYRNGILVSPDPVDTHLIAMFALNSEALLNGEMTSEEVTQLNGPEYIKRSEQWLKDCRDQICGWDASFGFEYIVRGKVDLLYSWSAYDSVVQQLSGELGRGNIGFAYPREGGFVYLDEMVIPSTAGNPKAAAYWINYVLSPEVLSGCVMDLSPCATVSDSTVFAAIQDPEKYPEETDLSYLFPDLPQAAHSHSSRTTYPPYDVVSKIAVVSNSESYIEDAMLSLNRVMCPKPTFREFWPEFMLIAAAIILLVISVVKKLKIRAVCGQAMSGGIETKKRIKN